MVVEGDSSGMKSLEVQNAVKRVTTALAQGSARRALSVVKWAIPFLLICLLGYSLSRIGWTSLWQARPQRLAFYLVPAVTFLLQPLSDLLIYRHLFRAGRLLRFSILLRKQSLNTLVLDYSGDTYFFYWVQRNLGLAKTDVLHAIKDTSIISAGASLAVVVACALSLASIGDLRFPPLASGALIPIAIGVALPVALCAGLFAGGRRVTSLTRRQHGAIFAMFLVRSLTFMLLGVLAWWLSGALPSLALCFEFVTARLVFSRLPLPSKSLLFANIAIATAGTLNLSAPRIAAVLVITALVQQLMAFVLVAVPWAHERLKGDRPLLNALYLRRRGTDISTS